MERQQAARAQGATHNTEPQAQATGNDVGVERSSIHNLRKICKDYKSLEQGGEKLLMDDLYQNKEAFKEFMNHVLVHVVTKTRMNKMGSNWGNDREFYDDVVSINDEAFCLLILEDRWPLWEKIADKRLSNSAEDQVGDEDDCRERKRGNESGPVSFVPGSNLTVYSMYGKLAPYRKGFNVVRAVIGANRYAQEIDKFRNTDDGGRFLLEMSEWWATENVGTKQKRKMHDMEAEINRDVVAVMEFSGYGGRMKDTHKRLKEVYRESLSS